MQESAGADSAAGRLHGLRAVCSWVPMISPPPWGWPLRPLLPLLAVALGLALFGLMGVAPSSHAVAPHPSPGHEQLNRVTPGAGAPLLPHLSGHSAGSGRNGTSGVSMRTAGRHGDDAGRQPLPVAPPLADAGAPGAAERALVATGPPALLQSAASEPDRGPSATAGSQQGRWLHAQVAEAAQKEALDHIWRQLSVLDAKAAAAVAAEVALGPAQAQELLKDLLAAEAADRGASHAGRHPAIPGISFGGAEEGGWGAGAGVDAPDPVCGPGSPAGLSPFRAAVGGRRLLLVMHEASLTGAPLAVAEMAAQARACGARPVHVVLLNWQSRGAAARGGPVAAQRQLLKWLRSRGVSVLKGKGSSTFVAANASDVVILGSATCARWLSA